MEERPEPDEASERGMPPGMPPHQDGAGEHTPPPGWRPISGTSLAAFIITLALSLAALVTGYWWLMAIPLVIAIIGMRRAKPAKYRGRAFAIWAFVLSIAMGSCTFMGHRSLEEMTSKMVGGVMHVLNAEIPDEERDARIRQWVHASMTEDETLDKWKARFAAAEERLGPYTGELRSASVFSSYAHFAIGPDLDAVEEVGPKSARALEPGTAFWAVARFEKGDAHVAVLPYGVGPMERAESLKKLDDASHAPILIDLRIYVPRR